MYVEVSYAFRCKPWEYYLLTEGITANPNKPQICIFGKKEIAPSFLNEYCYIDSKSTHDKQYLSKFGEEIFSNQTVVRDNYAIRIDTQIEFMFTTEVIEAIHKVAMPAIRYNGTIEYYGNESSGFLTFVRVYRIDRQINDSIMEKGRQGSSGIIRLYDVSGNETSVKVCLGEPIITDSRFSYLKDEIIHVIRSKGALICIFNNDDEGHRLLMQAGEIRRSMYQQRTYDLESSEDRAKTDYSKLFRNIVALYPNMTYITKYIQNVRPAQFGEIPILINAIKSKNDNAYNRLVDVHLRIILRIAYFYHMRYKADLEDLFQEGVNGLLTSIPRYDTQSDTAFSAYATFWIKQSMYRNIISSHNYLYVPVHVMEQVVKAQQAVDEFCYPQFESCCFSDLTKRISDSLKCEINKAAIITALCYPSLSIESMRDGEDIAEGTDPSSSVDFNPTDRGCLIENLDDFFDRSIRHQTIELLLENLKPRELEIIRRRFGLKCQRQTLDEVGIDLGVTRERIRQIEAKALRKLLHYQAKITKEPLSNMRDKKKAVKSYYMIKARSKKTNLQ